VETGFFFSNGRVFSKLAAPSRENTFEPVQIKSRRHNRWSTLLTMMFAFSFEAMSHAADNDFRLGGLRLLPGDGKSLKQKLPAGPLDGSLQAIGFLKSVGGIAFSQLATNRGELVLASITCDPKQEDGIRLSIVLTNSSGKEFRGIAKIADWQLIPLVLYSDSEFDACFTLFDQEERPFDQPDNTWRVQYHSAFEDTLLGLRLMQADIIAFVEDGAELPKVRGKYILGIGESPPTVSENRHAFRRLNSWIRDQDESYDSYLICDRDQIITYDLKEGGTIELTGHPMWLCWKHSTSREAIRAKALGELYREFARDEVKLSKEAVTAKYTDDYIGERFTVLLAKWKSPGPEVQLLPEYSRHLTARIEQLNGINKTVYDALTTVMRYSAFLKLYKAKDPADFRALVKQSNAVIVKPQVTTPRLVNYSQAWRGGEP
jgi:hypothetical protein